jgi:hypothetical protein
MRAFYLAWSGTKKLTRPVSETETESATKKPPKAVSELP